MYGSSQPSAGYVGAVDQGTSSSRFMIFDQAGSVVARHQVEHEQILPRPGWVEHDPIEIWERTGHCIRSAMESARLGAEDLAAVGIANQRETVVVWDRRSGRPYYNAIVWQDTRTNGIVAALEREGADQLLRERTGLPPASYFSAPKLQWILDNVDGVRVAAERGDALFGTVDTWLLWNLTDGEAHVTDVTNASRTMLMDLGTLAWEDELLELFRIPRAMLPAIRPSADSAGYGLTARSGPLQGEVTLAGDLGDQQAAAVGQACFGRGEAKNTYGTGNFMLLNTGAELVRSHAGLLTTVGHQFGEAPASYALEGSIAVTGAAVRWLRDQLGIIVRAEQSETLAQQVEDTEGVYFVPAFSGLFAPHWRADARGAIVGLSAYHSDAHIARASLEAICYQSRDVLEAMQHDSGAELTELKVDGGITANGLCMQLQADILGIPVIRPAVAETTALGAACAAGLAVGLWREIDELRGIYAEDRCWAPEWSQDRRDAGYACWQKAVERALGWIDST